MSFKDDLRKINPDLHMLYTKWGVKHLHMIDKMLKSLGGTSNLNIMFGPYAALKGARAKLVKNNAAYADADEILKSLSKKEW